LPASATLVIRPEQLKYVILHELAHVKRNDIAAILVMRVLLAIHWFNPILWYAYYRMREDQEIACDAFVLSRVGREETRPYVQTLIELVEAASLPARIPGLAGISGTMRKFKRRMSTILSLQPYSFGRSMFGLLLFIALGLLTLTTIRTTVDASGVFEAAYTRNAADRIMQIGPISGEKKNLLITNRSGEWKIVFVTETGEPDPEMADAEGILTLPESGYYSRPGVRNLEFVKGPDDKEWKLVKIREAVN
jgi:hypothetical protein